MKWLFPLLGIAVVVGTVLAVKTRADLEQKSEAAETLIAMSSHLIEAQQLSAVLKTLHEGQADAAARQLDLILFGTIRRLEEDTASADAQTRAYVQDAFRRIALIRAQGVKGAAAGAGQERSNDQTAADETLTIALRAAHNTPTK